MPDLSSSYKQVQNKINATKSYNQLKSKYDNLKKNAGESFDDAKSDASQSLDKLKNLTKSYERQLKNQFEQLLDINSILGGKGGNTTSHLKKIMVKTLKIIEPKIALILNEEILSALGCDQQQTFTAKSIYVKVKSVDLGRLFTKDPNTKYGKVFYEKSPINVQSTPFSMNRELYQRIQSGNPYDVDNGQLYYGRSGQPLFNIQYVETNDLGETGPWFKVDLQNRANSVNNVSEFMSDYYKSIKVVDFNSVISWIIDAITGAVSINGNIGINQLQDMNKFSIILQRILGLCFDNRKEIDVSGVSKVGEYDDIDDSFFEFTDIDLRNIDSSVENVKNGVVEFVTCDNVKLPVDSESIMDSLGELLFVKDDDLDNAIDDLTKKISDNNNWKGLGLDVSIQAEIDLNFVKNFAKGLVLSLISPKVLLPLFVMLKAIGQEISDLVESFYDFMKRFKKFVKNIISKIGAIFVEVLFKIIKKEIRSLLQSTIMDLAKEKANKKIIMILKLVQLLVTVSQFIQDWRKCKSVVDEILWLLKIATTGWGGEISLPLLMASKLLDGASTVRAFTATIEDLQSIGVPTGDMPDGSPNLTVLSMFSQLKGSMGEMAENGKVQVAIPPLTITPAGLTIPASGFGKAI